MKYSYYYKYKILLFHIYEFINILSYFFLYLGPDYREIIIFPSS